MEGSPPPENPRLTDALERAGAGADPDAAQAFEAALRESVLLVPVAGREAAEATMSVAPRELGPEIDAVGAIRPDGGAALLGFSDVEALELWRREHEFVAVGARDLAAFTLERGLDALWVNPAGPVSATVTGVELGRLAGGSAAAAPKPEPSAGPALDQRKAVQALARSLAPHPHVRAAYLRDAEPVLGRPHVVALLELAAGGELSAAGQAAEAALTELAGDAIVNVRALGAEEAAELRRREQPLYERE